MPLWHIYHPPAAFADQASKAALAKDLTALYMSYGMPAFYVNVLFHRMPGTDVFIGGIPQSLAPGEDRSKTKTLARPFIRLVGEHIAVNNGPDPEKMKAFCDRFDEVTYLFLFSSFLLAHIIPLLPLGEGTYSSIIVRSSSLTSETRASTGSTTSTRR